MNPRICHILAAAAISAAATAFSGCLSAPQAPSESVLKHTLELGDGISLHFMNQDQLAPNHRNLIFLAADDEMETLLYVIVVQLL